MSNARFSILQATAVRDDRISDSQFRTLAALGMYADSDGWCFPSLKTLGKDLHKSAQAVVRDTIALKKLGYIEVKNRYDKETKSRHSNLYRLKFDVDFNATLIGYHQQVDTLSTPEVDTLSTPEVEVNAPLNDPINFGETKKNQKRGDILDGMLEFGKSQKAEKQRDIRTRFESKLRLSPAWDGVMWRGFDNWLQDREKEGQSFDVWADWWISDEFRKTKQTVNLRPAKIRETWSMAFDDAIKITTERDGGLYV